MEKRLETVAYFCKKLHLRCSTGFWPRLWNPYLSTCLIHPIKSTIFPPITIVAVISINGARSSQEINPSGNTFHYWQYEGVQTFTITILRNGKKIILPGPLHTNKKDCTLNSLWDFVSVYWQKRDMNISEYTLYN